MVHCVWQNKYYQKVFLIPSLAQAWMKLSMK